ncbi:MAG TPA: hypothetical protein VGR76_13535 [Candidatus Angelobacter sp.]|nr:hypothetical protein [Candidatus Angelobacter sp.]
MTVQHRIMSILSTLLVAAVCSAPQLSAQQSNPSTAQQSPETQEQTQQQPTNTQPAQPAQTNQAQPATQQPSQPASPGTTNQGTTGTTVNPSQAPLQPVTTYPDASDAQQQPAPNAAPQTTTTIPEGPQPKKPAEPVGAATAESVPTAGGAAAKPAGVAIAPAKQHQTRSLMIKIGAALAAGAALGTVYALSHGTSSTPPGTGLAGVTGR